MKIIINNNHNSDSRESAIVEINTKHCNYPYSIRESLELALKLDGYTQETINKVFNQENEDAKKCVSEEYQRHLDEYLTDPTIRIKSTGTIDFPNSSTSHKITATNTTTNEDVISEGRKNFFF
jgi:hypothetical protein